MGRAQGRGSYATGLGTGLRGHGVDVGSAVAPDLGITTFEEFNDGGGDAFLQARQTLQAITETAVTARERRTLLASELVVPAIQLAQQIAEQLHAYAFDGEDFSIGEGEDMRRYRVREFNWKSGVRGRRSKHQAVVLMRVIDHPEIRHAYDDLRLLWDPRTTGVSWDLDSPPHVTELEWATVRYGRDVTLADGRMLAQWAKDALPLLELVRERERQHHADLQEGLAASAVALNQLAV